jgi:hypothetical protein
MVIGEEDVHLVLPYASKRKALDLDLPIENAYGRYDNPGLSAS